MKLTAAVMLFAALGCTVTAPVTAEDQSGAGSGPAAPASPPPCQAPEYRQFDFWVGNWEVWGAGGRKAGDNRIEPINGGCALQENYSTPGGFVGRSFNTYDATREVWHQTWVDSAGTLLLIEGGIEDGRMVMTGTAPRMTPQGQVLDRITWTPGEDGSVRQVWEISPDEGESWRAIFDGVYRRKAAAEPAQD